MYYHENTLIKFTLHDETKKRAHGSQIVRAKENLKLSHDSRRAIKEETYRPQTCKCKKGTDWLKRWVEAQHNIFKL